MRRIVPVLIALVVVSALWLTILSCVGEDSPPTTGPSVDGLPASSVTQTAPQASGYDTVTVNEAFARLSAADDGAQIVDVREPAEWAETGVPVGAVLISLGYLQERALGELAQDRPVYVICRSGNRSRAGSQILVDLGYSEVHNVDGGIQAWLAAGLPVQF